MGVKFKVVGAQKAINKLKQLERKVRNRIVRDAMKKGLVPILEEAQRLAPEDEGTLRDKLAIRTGKGVRGNPSVEIREGDRNTKDWHGQRVELGTSNMPPQPFMQPAAESKGPEAAKIVVREILRGMGLRGSISRGVEDFRKSKAVRRAAKKAKKIRRAASRRVKKARKLTSQQLKRGRKAISRRLKKRKPRRGRRG